MLTHSTDVLLYVYKYLDGKVSCIPNESKDLIITLVVTHERILYISRSIMEEEDGNDKVDVDKDSADETIGVVPLSEEVYMLMLCGF